MKSPDCKPADQPADSVKSVFEKSPESVDPEEDISPTVNGSTLLAEASSDDAAAVRADSKLVAGTSTSADKMCDLKSFAVANGFGEHPSGRGVASAHAGSTASLNRADQSPPKALRNPE